MIFLILLIIIFSIISFLINLKIIYKYITFLFSLIFIVFYVTFFKEMGNAYFYGMEKYLYMAFAEEFIKIGVAIISFFLAYRFLGFKRNENLLNLNEKEKLEKQFLVFGKILFLSALNFAFIENFLYFYNFLIIEGITNGTYILRLIMSSTFHLFLALLFLYHLEKGIIKNSKIKILQLIFVFILISIIHGFYNYAISELNNMIFPIIILFVSNLFIFNYWNLLTYKIGEFDIIKNLNYLLISLIILGSFNSFSFQNGTYQNIKQLTNDYFIINQNKEKIKSELIGSTKEEKDKILNLKYNLSKNGYYYNYLIKK